MHVCEPTKPTTGGGGDGVSASRGREVPMEVPRSRSDPAARPTPASAMRIVDKGRMVSAPMTGTCEPPTILRDRPDRLGDPDPPGTTLGSFRRYSLDLGQVTNCLDES